jgi:glycopeptide antibiotics resistance protein
MEKLFQVVLTTKRANLLLEKVRIKVDINDSLLKGYECLTVLLPFIITFGILDLLYKHKKTPQPKWKFLMSLVFIMYIFAVFYFTGVGTIFELQRYGIQLRAGQYNLIPFSQNIDMVAYFLNILLFLPFGFFLPLIWPNIDKLKYTVLSGFSFSFLIEISQLFNNRQPDTDDLLMNTLGTLLGYLLFKIFVRITKRTYEPVNHFKFEPAIYILAVFLGHFLMFDEFGLAEILYGF